ncbi:hypothetical protein ONZ45_g1840 [Pleurotus djamor]|nr:hypothetical protein ONZ45_g1840 [Pleurotus djamor]
MPKSAKKRKEKAADFSKAKLKLGKGKQTPSNVIDTSFKARSIALPSQSINREKDLSAPTTERGLSFSDLVTHTKHYSPGVRRDALHQIQGLFSVHPDLVESCLPSLINACTRLIVDEDASVRKTLRELFAWLLPQIQPEHILPHSSTLLLFTTSAQTHIFPEIRLDAIRFLDILLDRIPEAVVDGWDEGKSRHGTRVLEGYFGSLNAGTAYNESHGHINCEYHTNTLVILQSLSTFLQKALSVETLPPSDEAPSHTTFSSWFMRSDFTSPDAHANFDDLIRPRLTSLPHGCARHRRYWREEVDSGADDFFVGSYSLLDPKPIESSLQQLVESIPLKSSASASTSTEATGTDSRTTLVLHIARALRGTLVSTFLDFAPSVFGPNGKPQETDIKLVLAVANITRSLYSAIFRTTTTMASKDVGSARDDLRVLLSYMTPYFPFTVPTRDVKVEDALLEMSLVYCELVSFLTPGADASSSTPNGNGNAKSIPTEPVYSYITMTLAGEPLNGARLARTLTPTAYTALLPSIWSLINHSNTNTTTTTTTNANTNTNPSKPKSPSNQNDSAPSLFHSTLTHAIQTSSKSGLKKVTIELVGRIALLDTERTYQGSFRPTRGDNALLEEWITHLPKVLWELGVSSLYTTEVLSSLRSRLVPYFCITHPVRGRVFGPFTKLPTDTHHQQPQLRHLVLDLASLLLPLQLQTQPHTHTQHRIEIAHRTSNTINVNAINVNVDIGVNGDDGAGEGEGDINDRTLEEAVGLAVAGSSAQAYWESIHIHIHRHGHRR